MLVFSIKENIVRNVMIPILSALFLFLSGILIINWQLWQMAKMNNVHTATVSTQKIETFCLKPSVRPARRSALRSRVYQQRTAGAGDRSCAKTASARHHDPAAGANHLYIPSGEWRIDCSS
jgi:predicted negative regulator of RcsB-dependent stress response